MDLTSRSGIITTMLTNRNRPFFVRTLTANVILFWLEDFAHTIIVHHFVKIAVISDKEIFLYSVGQADKQLIERLPNLGSHSLASLSPLWLYAVC